MTDMSARLPKAPLGIGSLVGESFSILFGKFPQIFLIAFGPSLVGLILSGALLGFSVVLGTSAPDLSAPGAGFGFAVLLTILISIVVYGITTALLIQLAYDAKLGRPIQLGRYFGPAMAALVPLVVLGLVVGILFMLGLIALVIPGLWVYAVFAVVAPAVIIENAGFKAMSRSRELTKEYRWPIVGAIVLLMIISILINIVAEFLTGIISAIFGSLILDIILSAAISTIGAGLGSILVALIYARLREIKEGVSVGQIAAVFD